MALAMGTSGPMSDDIKAEFGRNLTAARDAAKKREGRTLSFGSLVAEMAVTFGARYVPSGQALADWHHGGVSPEGIRLEWVEWLASRYGVPLTTLSPVFAERLGPARELLARSRCHVAAAPPVPGQMALPLGIDRASLSVVRPN